MRRWGSLAAGIGLILVAAVLLLLFGSQFGRPGRTIGPRSQTGRIPEAPLEFRSNGEQIYFTATSRSGEPITFRGGPAWMQMHGGSCANCHGPDGRGGIRVHMTDVVAPDIRYRTLTSAEHDEHGGDEGHPPYTDALIQRAITEGLDPAGKPLDPAMPRWSMSQRDLDDVVAYLKTLDGERGEP
ncbi:MAG: cytochrome c [Armatimonadetes bacterium]|nr:cytochrome c [Armatimonadota bacterium]